jgi:hypothetical protein
MSIPEVNPATSPVASAGPADTAKLPGGFEMAKDMKSAFKIIHLLQADGTKKEYTFTVYFRPETQTAEARANIISQYNAKLVGYIAKQAQELGLGQKYSTISMQYDAESKKANIKGTKSAKPHEWIPLTKEHLSKKAEADPENKAAYQKQMQALDKIATIMLDPQRAFKLDDKKVNILKTPQTKTRISLQEKPKTRVGPSKDYTMCTHDLTRWLFHVFKKFPEKYPIHVQNQIIKAVNESSNSDEFRTRLSKMRNNGIIGEDVENIIYKKVTTLERSDHLHIAGNSRSGHESVEIHIPIAKVGDLKLTEGNLEKIFKRANEHTLNKRYAIKNYICKVGKAIIHRPNHNGTHSARQMRCLEALFDLIEKDGLSSAKTEFKKLTVEEKLNLKLAAYFLRAGRVDESSHKDPQPDDYYTRSASIYGAYASQLGVKPEVIEWTKKLIIDSCKPMKLCVEANKSDKSRFAYQLLTIVHELDLVRCFDKKHIKTNAKSTEKQLTTLVNNAGKRVTQLYDYSKKLCAATGCSRAVDNNKGNRKLFAECSLNGDVCLQKIRAEAIPVWR